MPSTTTTRTLRPRRQSGLAIIEMALTLPLLILVVSGIIQFGGMFFLQNEMLNLARDSARRLSVGEMTSGQVNAFVGSGFGSWPSTYTVTVTMPNPATPTNKDITVDILVPQSEASLMDIFGLFQQGNLRAKVTMRQE